MRVLTHPGNGSAARRDAAMAAAQCKAAAASLPAGGAGRRLRRLRGAGKKGGQRHGRQPTARCGNPDLCSFSLMEHGEARGGG